MLNGRDRDAHARTKQSVFMGSGDTAELLWFSADRNGDEKSGFAAGAAGAPLANSLLSSPAPAPSPAEIRDENDRQGEVMQLHDRFMCQCLKLCV